MLLQIVDTSISNAIDSLHNVLSSGDELAVFSYLTSIVLGVLGSELVKHSKLYERYNKWLVSAAVIGVATFVVARYGFSMDVLNAALNALVAILSGQGAHEYKKAAT